MKIEQIFCDDVLEDYACDYDYVIIMFMIMIRIMIMIMLLHFFKWWRHNKFWVDYDVTMTFSKMTSFFKKKSEMKDFFDP